MPFRPPVTVPDKPDELACENQVGSLDSTSSTPAQTGVDTSLTGPSIGPYVPPNLCVGDWQITGIDPDVCAQNEITNQQAYVAESLNISGAPINIYPLLGIHQQGGSVLYKGMLIGSPSAPGYPLSGINQPGQSWRSMQTGSAVAGAAYVGVDFGFKLLTHDNQQSEYAPPMVKWTNVGAVMLTQSNNSGFFASQVRVETTNGDVTASTPTFTGAGNGTLTQIHPGGEATQSMIIAQATSKTAFNIYSKLPSGTTTLLGVATVGTVFNHPFVNFLITAGTTAFASGDMFMFSLNYVWYRQGVFNVIQSPTVQVLNLISKIKCKAVRVVPTLFTGTSNWEVDALDVLEFPTPSINVIQDLFFNENRDREYQTTPLLLKCAYTPADSISDLSKFGLSILDQYVFTCSYATMVSLLGRPIIVGDIIEVLPELAYDQNLLPIRKFLDVTQTGWAASGFGPEYTPSVYRFTAQQTMPSQETRDIFGTEDTTKYLTADSVLVDGIGQQIDTTPLTITEEISKMAANQTPETGSDDNRSVAGVPLRPPAPKRNTKGNPTPEKDKSTTSEQNIYIASGLPPNGEPYTEGYALPAIPGPADGAYFRLYYAPEYKIPPRLFRFSVVKNAWLFLQSDERWKYTSAKPAIRSILESPTKQPLNRKQT